jgi:hypothetical protein
MIGPLAAGPRRLITSTEIRPDGAAPHKRRNGAGDGSMRAVAGRNTKVRPSPLLAASCRRRKCSGLACGSQHSSAPNCALFNTCSTAHKRSAGLSDWTTNTWPISIPACANAGAKTRCGGASRMMVLPSLDKSASIGPSRRNSPPPCCVHNNSVSIEQGQPPPGNSRSNRAKPVETLAAACLPIASPRHKTCGNDAASACAAERPGSDVEEGKECINISLRNNEIFIILYKNTVHEQKFHSRNQACKNLVLDNLQDVDLVLAERRERHCGAFALACAILERRSIRALGE